MDENHRFNVLEGQIADLHSMMARNFLILEQKADKIMSALTDLQASANTPPPAPTTTPPPAPQAARR